MRAEGRLIADLSINLYFAVSRNTVNCINTVAFTTFSIHCSCTGEVGVEHSDVTQHLIIHAEAKRGVFLGGKKDLC